MPLRTAASPLSLPPSPPSAQELWSQSAAAVCPLEDSMEMSGDYWVNTPTQTGGTRPNKSITDNYTCLSRPSALSLQLRRGGVI